MRGAKHFQQHINHDDVGPVSSKASLQRLPHIFWLDPLGRDTKCLRKFHKVGPGQLSMGGLAEGAHHVFAQDAVAAVVNNEPRDRSIVLLRRGQLRNGIHGGPIASNRQLGPLHECQP